MLAACLQLLSALSLLLFLLLLLGVLLLGMTVKLVLAHRPSGTVLRATCISGCAPMEAAHVHVLLVGVPTPQARYSFLMLRSLRVTDWYDWGCAGEILAVLCALFLTGYGVSDGTQDTTYRMLCKQLQLSHKACTDLTPWHVMHCTTRPEHVMMLETLSRCANEDLLLRRQQAEMHAV